MKILGIETSCDETAVCVIDAEGDLTKPSFKILGDALYSQAKIHSAYGGVFPSLAKREHAKNLPHLLTKALSDSGLLKKNKELKETPPEIKEILEREVGLFEELKKIIETIEKPKIDAIAVTSGPGLEPALWVGINFAKALGVIWNIPVMPTNHMEGHIVSVLLSEQKQKVVFPAIALLISGGHTELVLVKNWLEYEIVGRTKDDAVGEAFDKVARILALPYPGGPEISKLAEEARLAHTTPSFKLPRPMLKTADLDFSFSGLKTAVLYTVKKLQSESNELSDETKKELALEFENAAADVLIAKTRKALEQFSARTLIVGGGVIANTHIRRELQNLMKKYAGSQLLIPNLSHTTDNALMIAAAGYLHIISGTDQKSVIKAEGNLRL